MTQLSPVMMNHVIESTLALMVALLLLSISAIVRVRPVAPAAKLSSEHSLADDHLTGGTGFDIVPHEPGPALWAPPGPPGAPGPLPADADQRASLIGRRYEARHVRGRATYPHTPGSSGPPWGPAPPPTGRLQPESDRWT